MYWRLSDVVHLLRGGGSANYSQIADIPELDRAQIRGLASLRSIIPLLRYAAEAAKQPELFPTKAEEERIRITEKRIFAGLKLEAEKRKFARTQRTSREARVALIPSVVSRVLAAPVNSSPQPLDLTACMSLVWGLLEIEWVKWGHKGD